MICQTSRTNSSQMYPSNVSFHLFKLILMRPVAPLPTLNVSSPVLTTSCTGISIVALKFNGLLIILPILFLTRCGSVKLMEEKNGQTCLWLKIKKIVDNVLHQHFPPDCVHQMSSQRQDAASANFEREREVPDCSFTLRTKVRRGPKKGFKDEYIFPPKSVRGFSNQHT